MAATPADVPRETTTPPADPNMPRVWEDLHRRLESMDRTLALARSAHEAERARRINAEHLLLSLINAAQAHIESDNVESLRALLAAMTAGREAVL